MRFQFIAAEKAHHSLSLLCRCLRVTRSGFHAWRRQPRSPRRQQDRRLKVLIRTSPQTPANKAMAVHGYTAISREEHAEHIKLRKRVIRLMQEEGLKARQSKRFVCTTNSAHNLPVAANLLNREFTAEAPNRRWVGDTTEFKIGESGKLLPGRHPQSLLAVRRGLGNQCGE